MPLRIDIHNLTKKEMLSRLGELETVMAKHKALLLGTSYSAIPLLQELKTYNLHITACGKTSTQTILQHADDVLNVDYRDKEILLNYVKQSKTSYVIPSCNDTAYETGAYISSKGESLIPGYDNLGKAMTLLKKNLFKKHLTQAGILTATTYSIEQARIQLKSNRKKILVKPIDAFSGKGVTVLTDANELETAIDHAKNHSTSNQYLIEEFIEGSLHSHSAFFQDGEIVADFFADEFCETYAYQVDSSNTPSRLNKRLKIKMRQLAVKLHDSLGLTSGLLHTQFIANKSELWIVESMRRAPGDLYPSMIEKSERYPYWNAYIQPFIGHPINRKTMKSTREYISRHTVSDKHAKDLFSLSIKTRGIKEIELIPLKNSGDEVKEAPYEKSAILLIKWTGFNFSPPKKLNGLIDIKTF
tara:strand:+ start:1814 stop:3058 length:1245 start_codon:yes stop_codon:yes gene_type:complete